MEQTLIKFYWRYCCLLLAQLICLCVWAAKKQQRAWKGTISPRILNDPIFQHLTMLDIKILIKKQPSHKFEGFIINHQTFVWKGLYLKFHFFFFFLLVPTIFKYVKDLEAWILMTRDMYAILDIEQGSEIFFIKGQIVNILDFVDHSASLATT